MRQAHASSLLLLASLIVLSLLTLCKPVEERSVWQMLSLTVMLALCTCC